MLRSPHARPLGSASRWWLAQSLRALQKRLGAGGSRLVLRKGSAARIIAEAARTTGANLVFWNEIAHAPRQTEAGEVGAALAEIGVASRSFAGDLLADPTGIRNKEGRGLRVFTPFWRRVRALGDPPKTLAGPRTLRPGSYPQSAQSEGLGLLTVRAGLGRGLREP